jgi:hypothetical protein
MEKSRRPLAPLEESAKPDRSGRRKASADGTKLPAKLLDGPVKQELDGTLALPHHSGDVLDGQIRREL